MFLIFRVASRSSCYEPLRRQSRARRIAISWWIFNHLSLATRSSRVLPRERTNGQVDGRTDERTKRCMNRDKRREGKRTKEGEKKTERHRPDSLNHHKRMPSGMDTKRISAGPPRRFRVTGRASNASQRATRQSVYEWIPSRMQMSPVEQ